MPGMLGMLGMPGMLEQQSADGAPAASCVAAPCQHLRLRAFPLASSPQISSLAFSPDGTTLTTADASGTLIAWDLASSRRLATTSQHRGPIWSLAYSQGEGSLLASGGADHTVRIWNAKPPAAAAGAAGGAAAAAGKRPGSAAAVGPAAAQQQQAGKGPPANGAEGAAAGAAGSSEPYGLLCTWKTKLTPVFGLRFTTRNLLLGSGALTLPQRPPRT